MNRRRQVALAAGCLAAAVALAAAGLALAQTLAQGPTDDLPIWRVLGAFLLSVLLALGAALVLRKRLPSVMALPRAGPRRLRLLESLRLSHQLDVHVLEFEGREIVLASSPHGSFLISEGKAPEGPQP